MQVIKTVKLQMTHEEKQALRTVYNMLYNLEWADEKAVAEELGYESLEPIRNDIVNLFELGGGDPDNL